MSKSAVIVGSRGQDGTLLYEELQRRGYRLVGLEPGKVEAHGCDWSESVDIASPEQVNRLLKTVKPDEVYYLAAFHHSSEDKPVEPLTLFHASNQVNVTGLFHFLDGARQHSPATRTFYAASSHVFGEPDTPTQDETTTLRPGSIYAMTKVYGMHLCRFYRANHGLFTAVGILYNHESPLRGPNFLSKKIVRAALRIQKGLQDKLVLGSMKNCVDWGYAPEYVDAMTRILALPRGDEFVIASGRSHTVEDFVSLTFGELGLDWRRYVEEKAGVVTRRSLPLIGNATRLKEATGWEAKVHLKEMIQRLLEAERRTEILLA